MVHGASIDPTLDQGGLLCCHGPRSAQTAALAGRLASATLSAVILDGCPLRSTPENGSRAGDDGDKRPKGSKLHAAVDTMGHLLALKVTAANEQGARAGRRSGQRHSGSDQREGRGGLCRSGYTGENPADQAAQRGVRLVVVKLDAAKKGFVLLPRRWVGERSFAWSARFRRLARNYERLPFLPRRTSSARFPYSHAQFHLQSKCMTRSSPRRQTRLSPAAPVRTFPTD